MANDSRPLAFAFPGVGVRPCGRELKFFEDHSSTMAPMLEMAGAAAKADLIGALKNDTVESLPDGVQQYFTYGFGAAASRVFREMGIVPGCTAGYSFGIYAALFSAGALSFEDGILALEKAFDVMSRASADMGYGMGLTVGLVESEIDELLKNAGPTVYRVNSNNDTCHIFSGSIFELEQFFEMARKRDAFNADRLPVEIPYHHPHVLTEASAQFASFLLELDWTNPRCPVISSVDQKLLETPKQMRKFAASNLSNPISWKAVVVALDRLGYAAILECGPGISLTQNGRFNDAEIEYVNLKNYQRRGLESGA